MRLETWVTQDLVSLAEEMVLYFKKVNGSDFHFRKVTLTAERKWVGRMRWIRLETRLQ